MNGELNVPSPAQHSTCGLCPLPWCSFAWGLTALSAQIGYITP